MSSQASTTTLSAGFRAAGLTAVALSWPLILGSPSAAQPPGEPAGDPSGIGEVSLFGEEEFTIQAATKSEIPVSKAPGSVTVISARQIRESGARTIPELMRRVAGVEADGVAPGV